MGTWQLRRGSQESRTGDVRRPPLTATTTFPLQHAFSSCSSAALKFSTETHYPPRYSLSHPSTCRSTLSSESARYNHSPRPIRTFPKGIFRESAGSSRYLQIYYNRLIKLLRCTPREAPRHNRRINHTRRRRPTTRPSTPPPRAIQHLIQRLSALLHPRLPPLPPREIDQTNLPPSHPTRIHPSQPLRYRPALRRPVQPRRATALVPVPADVQARAHSFQCFQ